MKLVYFLSQVRMAAVPKLGEDQENNQIITFINEDFYHMITYMCKGMMTWLHFIPGEKQAEELGASLAAELMFYAVASAVLANEVDVVIRITILIINNRDSGGQRYHLHHNLQIAKHKRRELEEEELLEQEREEMLEQVEMMDMIEMMEREEMVEQVEESWSGSPFSGILNDHDSVTILILRWFFSM